MNRVYFFPYYDEANLNLLCDRCRNGDVVVFYFPSMCSPWIKRLKKRGILVLAYISIYKIPVLSELEESKGFSGGVVTKEEVKGSPFWDSVSIKNANNSPDANSIFRSENGTPLRPFGREDYKKGWYLAYLVSEELENQIMQGLEGLFNRFRVNGIFLDNVVSKLGAFVGSKSKADTWPIRQLKRFGVNGIFPGNLIAGLLPSVRPKSEETDWLMRQQTILTKIYKRLKGKNPDNLVFLNVGRQILFNPTIPADAYVTESFCFGDSLLQKDHLVFAGKNYDNEATMRRDTTEARDGLNEQAINLLAYTKVNGKLPIEQIRQKLKRAHIIASDHELEWTFRITHVSSERRKHILQELNWT